MLPSFGGAAISYALVGMASSVWMILLSRIIVGLVKQTMTVSSALAAEWSTESERAGAMGVISTATTVAWVSGSPVAPQLSALHPGLPAATAVGLYAVAAAVVLTCLPPDKKGRSGKQKKDTERETGGGQGYSSRDSNSSATTTKITDASFKKNQ